MSSPFDYAADNVPSFPGADVTDVIRSYTALIKGLPKTQMP